MGVDIGRIGLGIATGGLSEVARFGKNELLGEPGKIDSSNVHTPQQGQVSSKLPDYALYALPASMRDDARNAHLRGSLPGDVRDRQAQNAQQLHAMGVQALQSGRAAPQAQAAQTQGALIDQTGFNLAMAGQGQARDLQGAQIGRLTAAAEGRAPSAAELQMQQGLGQSLAAQHALANSARGGAAAQMAAQRGAAQQGSQMQGQVLQGSAALRAQEQASARGMLTDALAGVRGQDLSTAGVLQNAAQGQAALDQQTALANLQARQQAAMLNPELQFRTMALDDQRGLNTLGLGLRADTLAGQTGLSTAQLEQEYQRMLMDRDLAIQGANVTSANQAYAANAGMLSGGLGMLAGFGGG